MRDSPVAIAHSSRPRIKTSTAIFYFLIFTFHSNPNIMGFGFFEIVLILAVILLLFGARKIPELMRGIGKGINEFTEGKEGRRKDKE